MTDELATLTLGQLRQWWFLQHVPLMLFVFAFGACVGSFLNVVIYRLPAGMSVIAPPSRCPTCGARLKFFSENLPILGWLLLRGRCRYCSVKISPQYMLIELFMALLFLGLYWVLYAVSNRTPWVGHIGDAWWSTNGLLRTWPAFIAWSFLLAGLFAMTVIDARTFLIPIQIPAFVTVVAFIAYPLQAVLPLARRSALGWPIPAVGWDWLLIAGLGMLGLIFSFIQLKRGRLRYSFADYEEYVKDDEPLADYPHARREMLVELRYLLPCMVGLGVGWIVSGWLPATGPPLVLQALGATMLGYLVGGGMLWGVRILGSLAFGKEAMGMGDVHLLAAVGAVLGWFDPILIFFLAPFSGILWTIASMGLATIIRRPRRELPYGPHLAMATLILLCCRPGIENLWNTYMPTVPLPQLGLVP